MGFFSKLEQGGEFIIRSESEYFAPEIYMKGAKRVSMLPDEMSMGMRFRFGRGRRQFTIEGEQTFDDEMGESRAHAFNLEKEEEYEQAEENFYSALEDSETFEEFARRYSNLSSYDLIYAAHKLGLEALKGTVRETAKKWTRGGICRYY
ncbi:MAG: hypothetical protein ACLFUZ_02910 [Candidatus Micrarchaeia archaeon]